MITNIFTMQKQKMNKVMLIVSAIAFYLMNVVYMKGYILCMLFMCIILMYFSSSLFCTISEADIKIKIYSLLSSCGICLTQQPFFFNENNFFIKFGINIQYKYVFKAVLYIVPVLAIFFVFCLVTYLITMVAREVINLFSDMSTKEKIVYLIQFLSLFTLVVCAYFKTNAFYGSDYLYDVIYTSDSSMLVKGKVYAIIAHQENDIRQPLFAVFAAPFFGLVYLCNHILGYSETICAIFLNLPQLIMLWIASLGITRLLNLKSCKRIIFMYVFMSTYMYLLFSLMMEQYVVAFFYLIFGLLSIEKDQNRELYICGAGGTLLTSLSLLLFLPKCEFKIWIRNFMKIILCFVLLMFTFGRYDVFILVQKRIVFLSQFTGEKIPFLDRIKQYITFVRNLFLAPDAVYVIKDGHISYQLKEIANVSVGGVVFIIFAFVSIFVCRKKKISIISGGWIVISLIVMVFFGWGTSENGLILYSLYFGWPYVLLLFQLIETICEKLHVSKVSKFLHIAFCTYLLFVNLRSIYQMANGLAIYFPV